jgi:hypothetical protein
MMSAPRVYGLLFGLSIAAATGVETASSAGRQAVAATSDETWTIPGAGRTAGLNNTQFVSDLALTNLGSATANVTISFVGPGGLPAKPITLAAGATTVYRNILDVLWSANGLVGALSVHSDQPLVLRARTYNTAATGTFGVALPVYASDHLLTEGQTADSIWVQQDPSGSSGFRTNVGVVFPDAAGGDAVVTFFDASGVVVGTLTYSSATAGFQQQSIASVATSGLLLGRAQISVTRGHAAGYAVGVDNVTGDTSLYPLEALPAGVQDVVVSGVARLNGRNNTFFRTDARFYNPTPADATLTVRYHAGGASNPNPPSATVTLPAGRIVDVVDVLGSVLNLPVGSGGAVRFTADQPVAILARTSNVDPLGVQPGTFGAQQRPVSLASYLSSADAGAVVTAIRQDDSFRTNVGFAAGVDGATYRLTLKNAQGAAIATTTGGLGAFGWAQPSIADLFAGTAIPADATLLVEVTSGTVDVYDASLDNASGDLVVTPIAALPVTLLSSASIGPSGGSIRSADGRLTLKVPAGALAAPVTLSIAPTANSAPNAIGSAYALSPAGVHFERPAQLVFAYSNADLAGTGAGALGLASQEGSNWFAILGGSVDPVSRTLRVPITSTAPGPASAGQGRIPQRAAQSGTVGPYGSATVFPTERSVAEDDTVQLALNYVGPSSSGSSTPGYAGLSYIAPPGLTATWQINGSFGSGAISPTPSGLIATYTAPRCLPVINPVTVQVAARVANGPVNLSIALIRIIAKRWSIEVTYKLEHTCPANLYSFSIERDTGGSFEIHDGLVRNYLRGPFHGRGIVPAMWCPGVADSTICTQPQVSPVGNLELTDVTGSLVGQGLNPQFNLDVTADFPASGAYFSWTCVPEPPAQPYTRTEALSPAIPAHASRQFLVPYSTLTWSLSIPQTGETVTVTLTPKPCP